MEYIWAIYYQNVGPSILFISSIQLGGVSGGSPQQEKGEQEEEVKNTVHSSVLLSLNHQMFSSTPHRPTSSIPNLASYNRTRSVRHLVHKLANRRQNYDWWFARKANIYYCSH